MGFAGMVPETGWLLIGGDAKWFGSLYQELKCILDILNGPPIFTTDPHILIMVRKVGVEGQLLRSRTQQEPIPKKASTQP